MVVSESCTCSHRAYRYEVQRDYPWPGFADLALVRHEVPHGRSTRLHKGGQDGESMLFHRSFRPLLELAALESYAGQLARVAQHANDGTLGCFVVIDSRVGMLQIRLYERWFDGQRLHVDELAQRVFDPCTDGTLVSSAEFLAELRDRGERRDEEREVAYLEASVEDDSRTRRAMERDQAAEELARILASELTRPEN
jgi:hypothetical protein